MSVGGQEWRGPVQVGAAPPPPAALGPPGGLAPTWYLMVWRGRLLESSTGNAEGRLGLVAASLKEIPGNQQLQTACFLSADSVAFRFWLKVAGAPLDAVKVARRTLRNAFKAAGIGDPSSDSQVDVMLMLEEWPESWRAGEH